MMYINNKQTDAKEFAFDGCHKIYLIEDEEDKKEAISLEYDIFLPIEQLEETFNNACPLRFISNWKLTTTYVAQCEEVVVFDYA